MAYVRRIPLNAAVAHLKQQLTERIGRPLSIEYSESWWHSWIQWAIEQIIYETAQITYDPSVNFDADLFEAGLDDLQIDRFKTAWLDWFVRHLEWFGLVDPNPTCVNYEYELVTGGSLNGIPTLELFLATDPEPNELANCIGRIYPTTTTGTHSTSVRYA